MASAEAYAAATLPKSVRVGAVVWMLHNSPGGWVPRPAGRVSAVTADGPVVGGLQFAWTQCPLFTSEQAAKTWAEENPIELPGVSERVSKG